MTNAPADQRPANDDLPPHAHLWPDTARIDSTGRLQVAGLDVVALAQTYGTPLYLFDETTIRARCQAFRAAFAARWPMSAVAYAGKAFLTPALCRLLDEEGLELDAVSAGEIGVALAANYPAAHIHLHGNFKPDAELALAIAAGIGRIVVDSAEELERLEVIAAAHGRRMAIWLRLNLDVATATHAYTQTGHASSKFGLDVASGAALAVARQAVASNWLDLVGVHAHVGSQLFELTAVAQVTQALVEFAAELRASLGVEIQELSPGGGLAVAYAPEQEAPSSDQYAETVTHALKEAVSQLRLPPPRLVVEPGRALVGRAGIALYTIGARKATPGGVSLAVDGGMGDNPRPALYGAQYHAALATRMRDTAEETARVVGRYCESGDTLVEAVDLPRARYGETLAIPVSGAYHLPMASNYNGVPRPAALFLHEGRARLVRRRETLEDLLRTEIWQDRPEDDPLKSNAETNQQ
jgi:diaminopimelate decarboxylase